MTYTNILSIFAASAVLIGLCDGISTKLDLNEDEKPIISTSNEDEGVEVKHTIIVSTKLKNNKGLIAIGKPEALLLNRGTHHKQEDSGEVPVVKAYKSVDSTLIRTPDTRYKQTTQKPYIIRDEVDLYPNTAFSQWQPSSFYKNINYWNDFNRSRPNTRQDPRFITRRVSDDGAREFYCRKCRELNGPSRGCGQNPNAWLRQSTTPKTKVDGKLAKLN